MPKVEFVNFLDSTGYLYVFLTCLLGVLLLEMWRPRRAERSSLGARWRTNFALYFCNLLLAIVVFPFGAVTVAQLAQTHELGLLQWLHLPSVVAFVLAILLMDLGNYIQHWLLHRFPMLWRIHRTHHADVSCDATTSLRFHPLEVLVSEGFDLAVILACGASPLAVACYRVVRVAISTVVHGNISLGGALERVVRFVIVTPDLHRVHHSQDVRESNSNYSGGLVWWDKLFGTYCPQPERGHDGMAIGVRDYPEARANSLLGTLVDPFARVVRDE